MSTRSTLKWLLALAFAFAVLATACGSDGDADNSASTDETTAETAAETTTAETTAETVAETTAETVAETSADDSSAASADLATSSSDLGDILVDAAGNTIYLFVPDAQGDSTCYDQCEASWPIVGELSTVGEGLDAALLGTTERTTGDIQATYNGWPLYYFANDAGPGETNGQGVNDVWYVMDAAGNAIGS